MTDAGAPDPEAEEADTWTNTWTGFEVFADPGVRPLLAGIVGSVLAVAFGPDVGTKDLYVVTAQVIPVLLLALALEARVFTGIGPGPAVPLDEMETALAEARADRALVERARRAMEDAARRTVDLDHQARELMKELEAKEQIGVSPEEIQDVTEARRLFKKNQAMQVDARRVIQRGVINVDDVLIRNLQLQRRIRIRRGLGRVLRASWWGNRVVYVGTGVTILALGEFESLSRIAGGDYRIGPAWATAAIGYGFAAVFVAAFGKR